jgi:hypothetical protein
MSDLTTTAAWTPIVELNLETTGTAAFKETVTKFYEWAKTQPIAPMDIQSGWYEVTPQMAEDLLRRNRANRPVSLSTVKKYHFSMKNGDWKKTGQPLIVNVEGKAEDLQHRCWAAYLGKVSFQSFIIPDAPAEPDMFAYIDDNRPRSAGDALHTSGLNGLSSHIANAAKLAWRYDHHAIGIIAQPKTREMTTREVLEYVRTNSGLVSAAHMVNGTYGKAIKVIGSKPVTYFFAWRVIKAYGEDALDGFFTLLGSGANLPEDSPILGLRNCLLSKADEEEDEIKAPRRLALLIKALKMQMDGKKLGRSGLSLRDNEKFPRIEEPPTPDAARSVTQAAPEPAEALA